MKVHVIYNDRMTDGLRVFTAFSGYDSQCLALNLLGIEYDLVGWSEIDRYAIRAHDALFPQYADRNYGDISMIDWDQVPDFDLFTYSSPCQDFSQAGKQAGAIRGSGTRSSLLWECERAIEAKRPKYLVFENVAAVASSKFVRLFNQWQLTLERLGYSNFTQVLNAKTHGYPTPVPQNRERLFMVSILDCNSPFYFPNPQPLQQRLVDVLEDHVDERYYLSDARLNSMINSTKKEQQRGNGFKFEPKDPDGIASCINCMDGGRKTGNYIQEPMVLGWTRDEKGNVVDRHPVNVANAVTAAKRDNTHNYVAECRRIRKLTERECFRLMGVSDADINKIYAAGISKSQQYKLAGNSIVVNCLAAIFRHLLIGNFNDNQQTELF